jgi:hypothetical protein
VSESMERLRREDEDEREAAPPRPEAVERLPAQQLLALQRTAGNAAVARVLSASGRRMLARTTVRFNSSDLEKVMHIMPWKHGWDELIDVGLDMFPGGKPRAEDPKLLSEEERSALKEDYGKVMAWMTTALQSPQVVRQAGREVPAGQIYTFRYTVPKEQTRRGLRAFVIFITGLRPYKVGTTDLDDRYVIGDAWVETERQEYLKKRLNPAVDYDSWQADKVGLSK